MANVKRLIRSVWLMVQFIFVSIEAPMTLSGTNIDMNFVCNTDVDIFVYVSKYVIYLKLNLKLKTK